MRQLAHTEKLAVLPRRPLRPRLRVEPNPTWFLRMARSYGFLALVLRGVGDGRSAAGEEDRGSVLERVAAEQRLHYGLHMIACEDLGAPTRLLDDEAPERDRCRHEAATWLATWRQDPSMARDVRLALTVHVDLERDESALSMILGFRPARLRVSWLRPPRRRPRGAADRPFEEVHPVEDRDYLLLVEDLAETTMPGTIPMRRSTFRALCDRLVEKEAIVEAVRSGTRSEG